MIGHLLERRMADGAPNLIHSVLTPGEGGEVGGGAEVGTQFCWRISRTR